jgi:hypothetical protein
LRNLEDVDADTLFMLWYNFIERNLYGDLKEQEETLLVVNLPFPVVDGTKSYPLPSDFGPIITVDTGMYLTDANGDPVWPALSKKLYGRQNMGRAGIRFEGANVIFEPTPTVDANYILRYVPKLTDKVTTAELSSIPDQYSEVILTALKMLYYEWDRKYSEADFYAGTFENVLEYLRKEAPKINDNY